MPWTKNPKDFWAGTFYVVLGLFAFIVARDYPMGTANRMGAGYFPTILSGLLVLFGLIALTRSFLRTGEKISHWACKGLLYVTASVVLFGLLVRGAGLIVAIAVLILVSAKASKEFSWRTSLLLVVGASVFCSLVFIKGLGLPLPIIGPWFGFTL